jgi:hypothetical protein
MECFQKSCGDVFAMADHGIYLDLESRASQYLHIPDDAPEPMYLWAGFYYRQVPDQLNAEEGFRFSHILLRTGAGYINKIRYIYPEHAHDTDSIDVVHFLFDWHEAIKRAEACAAANAGLRSRPRKDHLGVTSDSCE